MNLTKTSVHRPVATIMVLLIILSFGVLSINNLKMDMLPNMNIPVAIVSTSYTGAGSEEVENLITKPLESALGTVPGLKTLTSTSSNGSSIVILEFEDNIDIDVAALDMREKVDLIKAMLPDDATDPMVLKIDINSMSNLTLGISSDKYTLTNLQTLVEDQISPRLERQDGIASSNISGGLTQEMQVVLNEDKLRGYGLSENVIMQTIASENRTTPVGEVKQGEKTLQLRVSGEFVTIADMENIPLTTPTGSTVYLRDVATITQVDKEQSSVSYINSVPSITTTLQKQSTANVVDVSDTVLKEVEKLKTDFPDINFTIIMDPADYIRSTINSVIQSALYGVLFAVLVLYIFLRNIRSTLIVATAMPISIVGTFVLMYYSNITINIMSLGGLSLGIGMLVDNSIVVLESIYRKIEEGNDRVTASVEGAKEVASSVIASTLTTVAVFLPISFVGGMTAQMFNPLSLTIAFSLMSSLLIALTFVPMACSLILNVDDVKSQHKGVSHNIVTKTLFIPLDLLSSLIDKLTIGYGKLIRSALKHKIITIIIAFGFVILTLMTLPLVGMELMPVSDEGVVTVSVSMPKGTLLEETEATTWKVVDTLKDFKEIDSTIIQIGGGGFATGSSTDNASVTVNLVDKNLRSKSSTEMAVDITKAIKDKNIAGADITATSTSNSMGNFGGSGVQVDIKGDDLETLTQLANDMIDKMNEIPGTINVTSTLKDATPQATITVDRNKAASYGISAASVSSIVSTAVKGSVASTFKQDSNEYDIRIEQDNDKYNYITDIENILVPSPSGINVPLYEIAAINVDPAPAAINRENQQRYVSVTASLDNTDSNSVSTAFAKSMESYFMPPNYTWEFAGSVENMNEMFSNLILALIISICLVYMIMAAQFESFSYPLIVMFSIPIAITGGLFGTFVMGQSITITSFLGMIMLAGVVINNAIVLIDYVNINRRERGKEIEEAILIAGPVRLRPILMSMLTTVLALLPMMLSKATGAEMMVGLATVVVFGLFLSTLVTLVLIPVIYSIIEGGKLKRKNKREAKRAKKINA